jgi:signal transduction histidine kinase
MLEQLLTIARLNSAMISEERVNVFQLVQVILTDIAPIALQRNITLSLAGDEGANFVSSRELATVLFRNLIDNAIKYAPAGSEVTLEVTSKGLSVNDEGPGIPPSERMLVFNRFYRRKGEATPGSGLGLAIVADLAKRLNLEVSLHEGKDGRGLCARVFW